MKIVVLCAALAISACAYAEPLLNSPSDNRQPTVDLGVPLVDTLQATNVEGFTARAALYRGAWQEAYQLALDMMARRIPDVDAVGTLAVAAAMLGEGPVREASLSKLLEVEREPRLYSTLARGIVSLRERDTRAAMQRFDAVLSRAPHDAVALYLRGLAHEQAGRGREALHDYLAATASQAQFAPALASAAQLQSTFGANAEAVILIDRAMAARPSDAELTRIALPIYQRAGLKEKAAALAAASARSIPGARDSLMFGAWALLQAGQSAEARNEVVGIAREFGARPDDRLLLAMAAADLGQYSEMQLQLTAYLREKRNGLDGVTGAGLVYIGIGDGAGALKLYRAAGQAQPDAAVARINLALAHQLHGELQEAEALLRQGSELGEVRALRAFLIANIRLAQGDVGGYRASIAEADRMVPGLSALGADQLPAAEKRRALAAWRNAAVLMLVNGWTSAMQRMADRVLALAPGDAVGLFLKGQALRASGHRSEAIGWLRRAVELHPRFVAARIALANALVATRRIEDARTVLASAGPIPEQGKVLFQIGMLHRLTGNDADGAVFIRRAVGTSDSGAWRREAEAILATAKAR